MVPDTLNCFLDEQKEQCVSKGSVGPVRSGGRELALLILGKFSPHQSPRSMMAANPCRTHTALHWEGGRSGNLRSSSEFKASLNNNKEASTRT